MPLPYRWEAFHALQESSITLFPFCSVFNSQTIKYHEHYDIWFDLSDPVNPFRFACHHTTNTIRTGSKLIRPAGPYDSKLDEIPVINMTFPTASILPPAVLTGTNDYTKKHEEAIIEAEANGFEVVKSDEFTILLDLDGEEAKKRFDSMRSFLDQCFTIMGQEEWTSKSGGDHKHIKLILAGPLEVAERIAIQALMGSDPRRELLTLLNLKNGVENPSVLFKPLTPVKTNTTLEKRRNTPWGV